MGRMASGQRQTVRARQVARNDHIENTGRLESPVETWTVRQVVVSGGQEQQLGEVLQVGLEIPLQLGDFLEHQLFVRVREVERLLGGQLESAEEAERVSQVPRGRHQHLLHL